jgi:hypothetical protein
MLETALSLMVVAVAILVGGAWFQWRRGNRKQAGLMLVLAAVMAANVAIWAVPNEQGATLVDQQVG